MYPEDSPVFDHMLLIRILFQFSDHPLLSAVFSTPCQSVMFRMSLICLRFLTFGINPGLCRYLKATEQLNRLITALSKVLRG